MIDGVSNSAPGFIKLYSISLRFTQIYHEARLDTEIIALANSLAPTMQIANK